MKLTKGQLIHVCNYVMKPPFKGSNSGFARLRNTEYSHTVELPGAWAATAESSVSTDTDICGCCLRIYDFGQPGAKAQCVCQGLAVGRNKEG